LDAAKKDTSKLPWRIPDWFGNLNPEWLQKFAVYNDELVRFNRTVSLVSMGTSDKVDLIHFSDSILGWQAIKRDFRSSNLYDIGSGNGFPGLVIAIMEPKLPIYLVESDVRKAEFLKHVMTVCGLSNVKVLTIRLEMLEPASIQSAVLRGFSNIPKALLGLRKVMAPKGKIYHFKGPEWTTEIAALPQQLCSTWNNVHIGDYSLPDSKITHTIVKSELI
jgi:16S rRNA (guanine527-N7)-methyltransferase